jgi:hypothetical protein
MPQSAWRRFDAFLYNPSNRAVRDYKEPPWRGMQHKPLQPRKEADLKVISLDVHAFEEVCAVTHVGKPPFACGMFKITVRRKEPSPQGLVEHLNIPPYLGRVEQTFGRRFYRLGIMAEEPLAPRLFQSLHWQ